MAWQRSRYPIAKPLNQPLVRCGGMESESGVREEAHVRRALWAGPVVHGGERAVAEVRTVHARVRVKEIDGEEEQNAGGVEVCVFERACQ